MRKTLVALSLLSLVALPISLACGGRTLEVPGGSASNDTSSSDRDASASSSSGGSSGTASGGGSSSSGAFPVCPNPAPKAGWACQTPNQGCAYVDYETGSCVSFVCDASGHWASSTPAGC